MNAWLINAARPVGTAKLGEVAPVAFPPPRSEPAGVLVDRVTGLAARLAPPGGRWLSAVQYPDLRAATATFSAGECQVSLAVQRLPRPAYVSDYTLGFAGDTYHEWPGGVRVVMVRHGLPHWFQVAAVRAAGVGLTATVTDGPRVDAPDVFAAWSGVDGLLRRVRDVAGDAAVDDFAAD